MTDSYFLNVLSGYDVGTWLVACVVVAGVYLLKRTVLKNHLHNPIVPYLPFLLGMAAYAVYYCVLCLTLNGFLSHMEVVLSNGFTVGALSALVCSLIEKVTGKTKLGGKSLVVRTLIQGFVPDGKLDEAAKRIADSLSAEGSEEDVSRVQEVLTEIMAEADPRTAEEDIRALSGLIVATLKRTA